MRPVQNLLILFLCCFITSSASLFAQQKQSFLVNLEHHSDLKIEGLNLKTLNNPGSNFEKLNLLGKPENTEHIKNFVEETWVFQYANMQLIYTNRIGTPELVELKINQLKPKQKVYLKKTRLTNKTSIQAIASTTKATSKKVLGKFIASDSSSMEKFNQQFSYLELILKDGKIVGILLKNKIL